MINKEILKTKTIADTGTVFNELTQLNKYESI